MKYSNYLVTISAFSNTAKITEKQLEDAYSVLHIFLKLNTAKFTNINHCHERGNVNKQLHSHSVIRIWGYFRYSTIQKIGPFRVQWEYLKDGADLQYAQIYTAKDKYINIPQAPPPCREKRGNISLENI